jgi:hypothetical protein
MADGPLSPAELERFAAEGFVALRGAVPGEVARACRDRIAGALEAADPALDVADPATWDRPVRHGPPLLGECFLAAARSPALAGACDQLVGVGRWWPRAEVGTAVVRFPHADSGHDDGWHVDGNTDGTVDLGSRERALLLLFLLSDVGPDDAPTRIWVGSHRRVPALLVDGGERGVPFVELAQRLGVPADAPPPGPMALATGEAGDIYLCHPFLVHAAQRNRGRRVRFMTQPPLPPKGPLRLDRPDGRHSVVEQVVREALAR